MTRSGNGSAIIMPNPMPEVQLEDFTLRAVEALEASARSNERLADLIEIMLGIASGRITIEEADESVVVMPEHGTEQ